MEASVAAMKRQKKVEKSVRSCIFVVCVCVCWLSGLGWVGSDADALVGWFVDNLHRGGHSEELAGERLGRTRV